MRRIVSILISFTMLLSLAACTAPLSTFGAGYEHFYKTVVQYSGENESTAQYLAIAERSAELFPLLEENVNAFVMDAYNYQAMDDEGTLLYTMNTLDYPPELDPNGQSIRVSKNYFLYNPIETADGSELTDQFLYDDLTLNILVPEQYREFEEQIIEAYRENFYFEKVTAENHYNEMAEIEETLDIAESDLSIHIIYVKDGQSYFTFRSDCAPATDHYITDPIVQIYTSNIHCNYAHSFLTQDVYFYSEQENPEAAYGEIAPYVAQCGAQDSVQAVSALN